MTVLAQAGDLVYRAHQAAWSAWARRRYARDFASVRCFLLFVGYPRSGHSLVGALVNAHRDAVVSHELGAPELIGSGCSRDQLYARILARARWFHLRGDTSNYAYRVPGQWQGRFASLQVLGDKRGGMVTRYLARQPDLLEKTRALVGVPLRLVHVVRNPFDNISAIAIWHPQSLEASIEFYFEHCRTTARLAELAPERERIMIRHEQMIRRPRETLRDLCGFLDLHPEPSYVEACASIVFDRPSFTRRRIEWAPDTIREVTRRARSYAFLAGYEFDEHP